MEESEIGLFNKKSSCLALALGVTKLMNITDMILLAPRQSA